MKQKDFNGFINFNKTLTTKQTKAIKRILDYGSAKLRRRKAYVKRILTEKGLSNGTARIIGRYWGWHCKPKVSIDIFEEYLLKHAKPKFSFSGINFYAMNCLPLVKWREFLVCDVLRDSRALIAVHYNKNKTIYDYFRTKYN